MTLPERIARIRLRLGERGIRLDEPASSAEVAGFERKHGILLSEDYRLFITEVGNGGPGPVDYGIVPLGQVPDGSMSAAEKAVWTQLRNVRRAFPFTRAWVWEEGATSEEGSSDQVDWGASTLARTAAA